MDPAGKLPQLVERGSQLGLCLGQQLGGAVRLWAKPVAGKPQREPEREQPLLRAVVEIALEPTTLFISGRDDSCTGGMELSELDAQLRLQALVLESESGSSSRSFEQGSALEERRIVHERRDRGSVWAEHCHGSPGLGRRQLDRLPVDVDIRSPLGEPERQLERRITERPRKGVPHRSRRCALELDDEIGDGRPRSPPPEQAGGERHGNGESRQSHDPEPAGASP